MTRQRRGMRAGRAVLLALACAGAPTALAGQVIVNTLRGVWGDAAPGWSGRANASLAFSEGNSDYLQLGIGAAFQLLTERHRLRLLGSETLVRARGEKVSESSVLHLRHNYRLAPGSPFATLLFVQNQSNPFQRIDRRTLVGAGARWDAVRDSVWSASLGASYMIESENLAEGIDEGVDVDHRGSFFLSVIGRAGEGFRIDVSGFFQPRLADWDDARAIASAEFTSRITGALGLVTAVDLSHDSDPAAGVEETDLLLRAGVSVSF